MGGWVARGKPGYQEAGVSWHKGGEPEESGEYVVVMGRQSKWLMTWNARDRRWFDGAVFRDPHWIKAHFRVPDLPKRG